DRVVQAQRLVALAPLVARSLVLVDDDGGYAELAQPGAERDAALAAADYQRVRLGGAAECGLLVGALLGPRSRVGIVAMDGAEHPRGTLWLLVSLQLLHRCQQRPGLISLVVGLQAQVTDAAPDGRLELDERRHAP